MAFYKFICKNILQDISIISQSSSDSLQDESQQNAINNQDAQSTSQDQDQNSNNEQQKVTERLEYQKKFVLALRNNTEFIQFIKYCQYIDSMFIGHPDALKIKMLLDEIKLKNVKQINHSLLYSTDVEKSISEINNFIASSCDKLEKATSVLFKTFCREKKLDRPVLGKFNVKKGKTQTSITVRSNWKKSVNNESENNLDGTLDNMENVDYLSYAHLLNISVKDMQQYTHMHVSNNKILLSLLKQNLVTCKKKIFTTIPVSMYVVDTDQITSLNKSNSTLTKEDVEKIKTKKIFSLKLPVIENANDMQYVCFYSYMNKMIDTNIRRGISHLFKIHGSSESEESLSTMSSLTLPMVSPAVKGETVEKSYISIKVPDVPKITILCEINNTAIEKNNVLSEDLSSMFYTITKQMMQIPNNLTVKFAEVNQKKLEKLYKTMPSKALMNCFSITGKKFVNIPKNTILDALIDQNKNQLDMLTSKNNNKLNINTEDIKNPFECTQNSFYADEIKRYVQMRFYRSYEKLLNILLSSNHQELFNLIIDKN